MWCNTAGGCLARGVRWDYDGIMEAEDGKKFDKVQLQPNAGKVPSTIDRWRKKNGGTHAVMGTMYVPEGQDADAEFFAASFEEAVKKQGL